MQDKEHKSFSGKTFGDLGDAIQIIPIARALGKMVLYAENNPLCKPILAPDRFNAIKPLMDASPYIECFEPYAGQEITHNMADFRDGGIEWGVNLAQLHARWVNVEISEEPWLKVRPNKKYKNKVICNRSTRHHNDLMDWRPILQHYLPHVIFIGLPDEHIQLQNETGLQFPRVHTENLLEAAEIIAGSKAFLGNQSSCLNLAIAMGKKYLCETSLTSVDTIFKRDCQYVLDGGVVNFQVDGFEPLNTRSNIQEKEVDWLSSPPQGFWIMQAMDGAEFRDYLGLNLIKTVNKHEASRGLMQSTKRDLINQMQARFPTWGINSFTNWQHERIAEIRQLIRRKNSE